MRENKSRKNKMRLKRMTKMKVSVRFVSKIESLKQAKTIFLSMALNS